jgi:hypothetical protein
MKRATKRLLAKQLRSLQAEYKRMCRQNHTRGMGYVRRYAAQHAKLLSEVSCPPQSQ